MPIYNVCLNNNLCLKFLQNSYFRKPCTLVEFKGWNWTRRIFQCPFQASRCEQELWVYEQMWKQDFWANCLEQFLKQFSTVEKNFRWLINSKTMWLKPHFKPFLVSILLPGYICWFAFFFWRAQFIFFKKTPRVCCYLERWREVCANFK